MCLLSNNLNWDSFFAKFLTFINRNLSGANRLNQLSLEAFDVSLYNKSSFRQCF
jgi:hypothetical protein